MDVDDADVYKRFCMKSLRSEALYDLIDDSSEIIIYSLLLKEMLKTNEWT